MASRALLTRLPQLCRHCPQACRMGIHCILRLMLRLLPQINAQPFLIGMRGQHLLRASFQGSVIDCQRSGGRRLWAAVSPVAT